MPCLQNRRRQRQRHKQRIKVGTSPPRILTDTDVCVVFMCTWSRQVFLDSELQAVEPEGQAAPCSLPPPSNGCVLENWFIPHKILSRHFPTFPKLWHTFFVTEILPVKPQSPQISPNVVAMLNCEIWARFVKPVALRQKVTESRCRAHRQLSGKA